MLGGREAVAAAAKEPQAVRVYHCNFGAKLRPWGQAERAKYQEQLNGGTCAWSTARALQLVMTAPCLIALPYNVRVLCCRINASMWDLLHLSLVPTRGLNAVNGFVAASVVTASCRPATQGRHSYQLACASHINLLRRVWGC